MTLRTHNILTKMYPLVSKSLHLLLNMCYVTPRGQEDGKDTALVFMPAGIWQECGS